MNSRVVDFIAQDRDRWALAGDQLFVDLDLSAENLPPGTRLSMGTAVIEVTPHPHTGCAKFVERFGVDAMKFVNSPRGRQLSLRGINARVVRPGRIHVGDVIKQARVIRSVRLVLAFVVQRRSPWRRRRRPSSRRRCPTRAAWPISISTAAAAGRSRARC